MRHYRFVFVYEGKSLFYSDFYSSKRIGFFLRVNKEIERFFFNAENKIFKSKNMICLKYVKIVYY